MYAITVLLFHLTSAADLEADTSVNLTSLLLLISLIWFLSSVGYVRLQEPSEVWSSIERMAYIIERASIIGVEDNERG